MSSRSRELMGAERSGGIAAWMLAVGAIAMPSMAGECTPDWLPGTGVPGVFEHVYTSVMWDPDGGGPQQARLVVGGKFSVAGDQIVNNIAMWDGASWQPMGAGLSGIDFGVEPHVNALVVTPSGELIAGGRFLESGSTNLLHVAKWNGTSWQPLSPGGADIGISNNIVQAMAIMPNGDLIVGGQFSTVGGGTPASEVARWNGTAWSALPGLEGTVESLVVRAGEVIAGGIFHGPGPEATRAQNVARWDGTTWQPLTTAGARGVDNWINVMTVMPNGDLILGGGFTQAGSVSVPGGMARWNGSTFSEVGGGVNDGFGHYVLALAVDSNGHLLVGGQFIMAGDTPGFNGLARWDGSTWTSLWGAGETDFRSVVRSIIPGPGGSMVAAGRFNTASGTPAKNVARFDGSSWHGYGTNGTNGAVGALATTASGDVIAGGSFKLLEGVAANRVAIQNGSSWSPMGTGLFATNGYVIFNLPFPTVNEFAVLPNGDIVAGGHEFATTNGGTPSLLATWNGTSWAGFTPPLSPGFVFGPIPFGLVLDIVQMPNGNLVAAGVFALDGDPFTPQFLVEWDGTNWSPLGGVSPDNFVHDLLLVGNDLYIGGDFSFVGGIVDTPGIVRWDGSDFHSVGKGTVGSVFSMIERNGEIIVAGGFTEVSNAANGDTPADRIVRWNGTSWSALPGGGLNFEVFTMAVMPNNDLVVGGGFTDTAAGTTPPARRIARWNGANWSPMGTGIDEDRIYVDDFSEVNVLLVQDDGTLLVGGNFATVDGAVSANIARWGCPGTPACPADFNGDDTRDVADLFAYINAWLAKTPNADFNDSGSVDVADLFAYINAWLAGC